MRLRKKSQMWITFFYSYYTFCGNKNEQNIILKSVHIIQIKMSFNLIGLKVDNLQFAVNK